MFSNLSTTWLKVVQQDQEQSYYYALLLQWTYIVILCIKNIIRGSSIVFKINPHIDFRQQSISLLQLMLQQSQYQQIIRRHLDRLVLQFLERGWQQVMKALEHRAVPQLVSPHEWYGRLAVCRNQLENSENLIFLPDKNKRFHF